MGTTKSIKFSESQNRKAELFKALGHPARIAIIEFLINQNSCVCGDIVEELPLSQSTISQHLKELKSVGIIKGEISGVKTCYCIDENVWAELDDMMKVLMSSYSLKNKCC
ncbi:MAG: winged helix-turn-helix transcriptional regulator [Flavobacteriales bacterium]|jgi:DNA-binding transcriptional ArsR family regulator|nr:winged helix-turn-helix transcriptional regulator [Flavobacteriales bacterium]